MWDSGNPVGSFDGIAKRCNSIDFKPTRPFRIVTGAEDFKVNFYEGPPFKFQVRRHANAGPFGSGALRRRGLPSRQAGKRCGQNAWLQWPAPDEPWTI
jgi:hypothetical protein